MRKIVLIFMIISLASVINAKSIYDFSNKDRERQDAIIMKNLMRMNRILKYDYSDSQIDFIKKYIAKRLRGQARGDHVIKISEYVMPWAGMEKMDEKSIARTIVFMDQAVRAGIKFEDAEDLIPAMTEREMPLHEYVLVAQYNSEMSRAKIPEFIIKIFLSSAMQREWDGFSIIAGGRGLLLAKAVKADLDKASRMLLGSVPKNGRQTAPEDMVSKIISALEPLTNRKLDSNNSFLKNYSQLHKILNRDDITSEELKRVVENSKRLDDYLAKLSRIKPKKEDEPVVVPGKKWDVLDRNRLMSVISGWIGVCYRWGGMSKSGVDCSGFTRMVLTHGTIGVPKKYIPHSSRVQYGNSFGKKLGRNPAFKAGDLIFFSASPRKGRITHVGLTISGDTFVHASSSRGVTRDKINSRYWKTRRVAGKRIFSQVK